MAQIIRYVDSLDDFDPAFFAGDIFVLPDGIAWQAVGESDELGGIGSFFKKLGAIALPLAGTIAAPFTGGLSTMLIGVGGSVGGGLLASSGAGAGGQAKGFAAIQSAGQQVIDTFATLKQKTASGEYSKADAYAAADKLVSVLSDSSAFYPAKKGKDAEALAGFKTQAAQLAAEVKSLADAADAQKRNAAAGATTGSAGNSADSGLPFGLSPVGIAIGAIAAYFIFFRR